MKSISCLAILFTFATSASYSQTTGIFSDIGIGTSAPAAKLDIHTALVKDGIRLYKDTDLAKNWLSFSQGNGTNTIRLGQTTWSEGLALYRGTASTSDPMDIIQRWAPNGNVGIGTINISDPGFKLFVEVGIRTRKVKVDQQTWSDYVFYKDYKLLPLNELEKFINKNKHLPEIPSAKEVAENGLDLGDNQAQLLKKIEELTLYIIQLNKKVEQLTAEKNAKN